MKLLMITWTDIFEATGSCFEWCFGVMRKMAQTPNIICGSIIVFLLAYWCVKIIQQKKKAIETGTYE